MPTTNTPSHLRPWSVIEDAELKQLREIARLAKGLQRGCDCEYDHRCGRCQKIIDISNLAERVKLP
ncbi:MAG: hypothetical protein JO112_20245 [Planctomycetes bacterium]|nr:hypothetical protein [Planctomycetota bacterium]